MGIGTRKSIGLSKSKVMHGLQCTKRLYLSTHSPKLGETITQVQQARFDEGTAVGRRARLCYPDGILVSADHTATLQALAHTRTLINAGATTLFEPAFIHDNVLARIDILTRKSPDKPWDIIEVKSSTQVKDEHISDVAIQTWIMRSSGEKVRRCFVMFINTKCIYPNLENLFLLEDVTEQVETQISEIPKKVKEFQNILSKNKPPAIDIGRHCNNPYECPFKGHCWPAAGIKSPSIFELPGVGGKAWEFYNQGIISLHDMRLTGLKGKAARALDVVRKNTTWIDHMSIMNGIKTWKWPLHFLDFETINPAIPRFEGTRPYQQIPFQFSCHIQQKPGSEISHIEYLHQDSSDPRPAVAAALVDAIGPKGNIVAYNKSVEAGVIKQFTELYPKYSSRLNQMENRFVDPLSVIRGSVYAPDFHGSFSIKAVAPALLGKKFSYEELDLGEGQAAQVTYDQMIASETSAIEKKRLKAAMLAYCRQDTLAMVGLVEWLYQRISE